MLWDPLDQYGPTLAYASSTPMSKETTRKGKYLGDGRESVWKGYHNPAKIWGGKEVCNPNMSTVTNQLKAPNDSDQPHYDHRK